MPSKTKKCSKSLTIDSDLREDDLLRSLEEASKKHPSLIGNSATVGKLTDVELQSRGCKIWLSESSMAASGISPGSTVSVSLASMDKSSNSFPLVSLADECSIYYGLETQRNTSDESGTYFALATVFPSCKILKNGVRLSSNLSYTMGCPAMGCILFVYPIQNVSQTGLLNGNHKQDCAPLNFFSTDNPKDLYLELLPSRNRLNTNKIPFSPVTCPPNSFSDRFENGSVSSPKTPVLNQSNLKSSSSNLFCSPMSGSSNPNAALFSSIELDEVFGDEKSKKIFRSCASSWLNSRSLLFGNFLAIPILSNLFIFRVAGADKMPAGIDDADPTNKRAFVTFPMNAVFIVNNETKINFILPPHSAIETQHKDESSHMESKTFDVKATRGHYGLKLGGLSKEYADLKDIISSLVEGTLSRVGLRTTKGVLLYGPPGTGKTSLARLCTQDAGVNLFTINGHESETALHEVFDSASQVAPAVVFIDELDAIAPTRREGGEGLSQRLVATLLNLMDGFSRTSGILVIAATNRPDSIEPALRRPGRFDREIEIGVPSPAERLDILLTLLSEMEHCLLDSQIQQLAATSHGFVGADLASLCTEAAFVCLQRHFKLEELYINMLSRRTSMAFSDCSDTNIGGFDCSSDFEDTALGNRLDSASTSKVDLTLSSKISYCRIDGEDLDSGDSIQNGIRNDELTEKENDTLKITFDDFENARRVVGPSSMREVALEVPKVKWEDVGGQDEVKRQLIEAVEWPQKHQGVFEQIGIQPPTGVLMFGPPGCSKTLMARAIASEAGLNFLAVKGPELFSKWVGESEKAVKSLFRKAGANAPSIIFFDEIDGLAIIRGKQSDGISVSDRVTSQLLVEMDGLHQRVGVTVIAATNRPDKIDPALLRPGRFNRLLYVGPPNEAEREDIFRIHLRKTPCGSDVSVRALAGLTEGCTGADISFICSEAAVAAIEESCDASEISMRHLTYAIGEVQPMEIQSFQELSANFQRLVLSDPARKG